jgi:hypothetical protein
MILGIEERGQRRSGGVGASRFRPQLGTRTETGEKIFI